jgi:hypothetical protein
MTFQDKLIALKQQMFNAISTKDISFLYNLDKRIKINAEGIYNFETFSELHIYDFIRFLHKLESDKIYVVIPILSKNNTPSQPFIVLSQQFLITRKSNYWLITKHLYDKSEECGDLYDIDSSILKITLKYKEVKLDYNEYKTF